MAKRKNSRETHIYWSGLLERVLWPLNHPSEHFARARMYVNLSYFKP